VWALQYFQNNVNFCPQKVEKTTIKSCSENLKSTRFPLLLLAALMTQTEEFMVQNVAYRPTVYIELGLKHLQRV
jgi:hypothetical protein